jgi:hypothetical protein
MKTKKSTLKKRRTIKYVEIAAVVLLIAALVTVAIIIYKAAPKASDYFAFSDLGAEYETISDNTQIINVKQLNLTVMPIGGNATNFHIDPYPGDKSDPKDYFYPEIVNGTKQTIQVTLDSPVQSIKNGTTYPFTIFVYSDEAQGNVTLQIRLRASDYFAFSDLGAEYETISNNTQIIRIKNLYLAVTPIGGNATNFHIDPGGKTDPIDYFYPEIVNGTKQTIQVTLNYAVQSIKNGTTYPFTIRVYCDEAEGSVTLHIPEAFVTPY